MTFRALLALAALGLPWGGLATSRTVCAEDGPPSVSGIYPHLTMFNNEGECGTGAVVPWADRLWVMTYGPHLPDGSSDKLYEITPDLKQIVRPESVGGTHANRMIHRESRQLFIGPYVIDAERNVRVIPTKTLYGRLTGNARHLTAPAERIYYATMEEGFYDVDVKTLAVTELFQDGNRQKDKGGSLLPGYHGKGLSSGQGRLVYANNGENSDAARARPEVPSGVLAEWDGKSDWKVVRRNQFTEVTGSGGIEGNLDDKAPLWSIGWDHRSLILMVLDEGTWHTYRLPKASHSYDGAHGWNTEWPRIRDIGEADLLMTMHGAFWKFPRTFSPRNSAGIAPRSNYLKVVGDFCRWQDRVVLGCDDTAHNEFLNRRKAKGAIAGPQSQSNLWFVEPSQLDGFGPALGRGAVWLDEDVAEGMVSEPFLISGFAKRMITVGHRGESAAVLELEVDEAGDGRWKPATTVILEPNAHKWVNLGQKGIWLRVRATTALTRGTFSFQFAERDDRPIEPAPIFTGLSRGNEKLVTGGLLRARDKNKRTLSVAAVATDSDAGATSGYYELDETLKLRRVDDPATDEYTRKNAAIPAGVLAEDAASILFVDDAGRRWRLPKGDPKFAQPGVLGAERVAREVATERDLFSAHGTFYELPAENAGGFAKVRPVATHGFRIHDFCSYRGLFVMTGISSDPVVGNGPGNPHVIRSEDGLAAVWVGAIDDVWRMGKPRGTGGPWLKTTVTKETPSDPYLMTGYDQKRMTLRNDGDAPARLRIELDVSGTGLWKNYREFDLAAGATETFEFPESLQAYWLRAVSDQDGTFTVQLEYR